MHGKQVGSWHAIYEHRETQAIFNSGQNCFFFNLEKFPQYFPQYGPGQLVK